MKLKLPLYLEKGKSPNTGIVKDADGRRVDGHLDSVKQLIVDSVNSAAGKDARIKALEKQVELLENELLEEI